MIHSLTVSNFRAIRGTRTYDLKSGVNAFIGRNEAGKSSSLLALAYACYGAQAMPEGINADDLVNDHAKEMSVTVAFDHAGHEYVLTRSQRRDGRGDASLTRDGQPFASGRAPVTEAITQLFGVDHVGFMVSVFARQDELDALAGKRGAERISTMLRLLGVDQAEGAVKEIRKQANEERRALEVLRASVGDVEALERERDSLSISLAQLADQHAVVVDEEASLDADLSVLRDDLSLLVPKREAYEAWQRTNDAAQVAVATARVRLEDARQRIAVVPDEPTPPDVEPVEEQHLAEAEESYRRYREEWAVAGSLLSATIQERDALTDSCAACGRPFDNAEQVAEHRAALEARIAELTAVLAEKRAAGETARAVRDDLAERRDRYVSAQRAYDQAVRERAAAIDRNNHAQADVARLEEEHRLAVADAAALGKAPEDPSAAIEAVEKAIEQARVAHSDAKVRLATLTESIRGMEARRDRVDADLARAGEKAVDIAAKEQAILTLDVAAKEMVAMKERLIGGIIPALEQRASSIVADLTDGKHTELRLTPDYEIQYVTETGALRSFASLSGGAQDVFALALRLAIAELRAGSVSFLVLDEVFESLDDERQGLAWEGIERLSKRYEQVMVVTHVAALKERAATVIEV